MAGEHTALEIADRLIQLSISDEKPVTHLQVQKLNQSQGEMRRRWGSNDGAGSFSKYG